MLYFLDIVETVPDGVGFSHFDTLHLGWLLFAFVSILGLTLLYRSKDDLQRSNMRKVIAALIVADELWKMFWLTVGGRYTIAYLPLHLCSINIFIIAYHSFRPNQTLDNFLYMVCIPGAFAALLFPSWVRLPFVNFMHLHSFTIHTLLAAYPIMLTAAGDIKPDAKLIPKGLALLMAFALPIYIFNWFTGENYMFLMYADPGNPLYFFDQTFGTPLVGFPFVIAALLLLFYGVPALFRRFRKTTV